MQTFSTAALSALNASGSVGLLNDPSDGLTYQGSDGVTYTSPFNTGVADGVFPPIRQDTLDARIAIWAGPVVPNRRGVYLTWTPGARLGFVLLRRPSGTQARREISGQMLARGHTTESFRDPVCSVTASDILTLTITHYQTGSITMTAVQ